MLYSLTDRLILELKIPPQDCYLKIRQLLDELNALVTMYGSDLLLSPLEGNVCFASARFRLVMACHTILYYQLLKWQDSVL